ncbi:MAG: tRNA (guanosine(46)-N7)-methyltransferase TrmB [Methylococcaceae bacterium]|nr:tRNA (guanosine(46)-N7)-methyltransferase TrmB [Methylococcaceae bacterium]MCI0667233.1 tRNA (guanosine(46)-N7)-methyltransferase TrmB [Methylococcaceae bacterium]MCI0732439.1 tRNA (guanosine(46)-N7)-methyltransferase TrmB [Methylococcaceae bacterium]
MRTVRSFVRRRGRITAAQRKALANLWPVYGLESQAPFDPEAVFGRKAALIVEIGFGDGANLAEAAEKNPQNDYLGIEVHEPGIGRLLNVLAKRGIGNVRIFPGDAVEILRDRIAEGSIDRINLFFPDPWPKKRHHKRRLVSADFAGLIASKLKSGGCFHAATDWEHYADCMAGILDACDRLRNLADSESADDIIAERSVTRFEKRGLSLGHRVRDIVFVKL